MNTLLKSEKGFGLIQVIASLLITSGAIAALFISSYYAQSKANEHYHYRSALLQASGRLELIKYYNRSNSSQANIENVPGLYDPIILDRRDGILLMANLTVNKTTRQEIIIAPYAGYDEVTITLSWDEPSPYLYNTSQTQRHSLVLREDYYRRIN